MIKFIFKAILVVLGLLLLIPLCRLLAWVCQWVLGSFGVASLGVPPVALGFIVLCVIVVIICLIFILSD